MDADLGIFVCWRGGGRALCGEQALSRRRHGPAARWDGSSAIMFMANATTRISIKSQPSRRGFSITFALAAHTPLGRVINTGGSERLLLERNAGSLQFALSSFDVFH